MAKSQKRKSENSMQKTSPYKKARYNPPRNARRGEAKFFDTASASYALNTTGSVTHLDIVPQGTTVSKREGKEFHLSSVQIRGVASSDTATATASGMMMLVWDKQPNKVIAVLTDILDTASSQSFIKRENAQRFSILKKWRWAFAGNATAPTATNVFDIDDYMTVNLKACCTSADTDGAIGTRITGALYLVTCGTIAAGTADANAVVSVRVNFRD